MTGHSSSGHGLQAHFEPLSPAYLARVMAVEQRAYAHPWSRSNFLDTLEAGYQAQLLLAGDVLLGYFVAMTPAQHHGLARPPAPGLGPGDA